MASINRTIPNAAALIPRGPMKPKMPPTAEEMATVLERRGKNMERRDYKKAADILGGSTGHLRNAWRS